MNYLDLIIAIPLAWGAWKGWQRGIIFEIAMLIGMILGLYIAFKFSGMFQGVVGNNVKGSGSMLPYLTFFLVFIAVVILMVLLGRFLEGILKITKLTPVNQVLGAIAGSLKFALAISVLLSVLRPVDAKMGLLSAKTKSGSFLYKPILNVSHLIYPALKDIKEEFEETLEETK
jgi:membrane protein required for colicin V production